MKTRETKQKDLDALTASLQASKSAMIVGFNGVTVNKDQEFRQKLREAGASYQVVKNTLARIAVQGTQFENATEHFKGVTALAWTEQDPVILSKAISSFVKENGDRFTFKAGVVEGKLVDLSQLTTIANLPSKEELISKLLFVINAQAQRLVTVINAVPRNLAIVIKQIGDQEGRPAGTASATAPAPAEEAPAAEAAPAEASSATPAEESPATADMSPATESAPADVPANEGSDDAAAEAVSSPADAAPADATENEEEAVANAPDDAASELSGGDVTEAPAGEAPAEEPAAE